MSKIQTYRFGKMTINGESFSRDLLLTPTQVLPNWRRTEGHRLCLADLENTLAEFKPEILVIGTGKFGLMKISEEFLREMQSRKIEVISGKTDFAVQKFNEFPSTRNVLGAFHLTC